MFFIAYAFKGQVHVFAGQVKILSHSSCKTSAKLKYFCPLTLNRNLDEIMVIFYQFSVQLEVFFNMNSKYLL